MRSRCKNPKNCCFYRYGGHGVKCLWKSFEEFKEDMYESYRSHVKEFGEKNTQIDRTDPRGNYESSNCRWATLKEQARNKTNNRLIVAFGRTKTAVEWGEEIGISDKIIRQRIDRGGWLP